MGVWLPAAFLSSKTDKHLDQNLTCQEVCYPPSSRTPEPESQHNPRHSTTGAIDLSFSAGHMNSQDQPTCLFRWDLPGPLLLALAGSLAVSASLQPTGWTHTIQLPEPVGSSPCCQPHRVSLLCTLSMGTLDPLVNRMYKVINPFLPDLMCSWTLTLITTAVSVKQ